MCDESSCKLKLFVLHVRSLLLDTAAVIRHLLFGPGHIQHSCPQGSTVHQNPGPATAERAIACTTRLSLLKATCRTWPRAARLHASSTLADFPLDIVYLTVFTQQ